MDDLQLSFVSQSRGEELLLKSSDYLTAKEVARSDPSTFDDSVFQIHEHKEHQSAHSQEFALDVPRLADDEKPAMQFLERSADGAAPISIHGNRSSRSQLSAASSLDERHYDLSSTSLSRHTPGTGTLESNRFRRLSPGSGTRQYVSLSRTPFTGAKLSSSELNPYNPAKNQLRMTAHIRRWQHIFPKLEQYAEDDPMVKWFSLATPACLPLTTDFFPSSQHLAERYGEYSYILSPFVDDANIFVDYGVKDMRSLDILLMELVYHRLAQGFQIVVLTESPDMHAQKGPSVKGAASGSFGKTLSATDADRKVIASNDAGMWTHSSIGKHIYLSLGDHVHHLAHDSLAQNIEVKRYVLKSSRTAPSASYHFALCLRDGVDFCSQAVQFQDSRLINYNWNYLDHLIAGYQEEMTDALRFWRTRFLLIPSDSPPLQSSLVLPSTEILDDEELRLAGFSKFLEVFEKSRWILPAERISDDPKAAKAAGIQINLTTFTAAGYVVHEWLRGPTDESLLVGRNLRPLNLSSTPQSSSTDVGVSPRDQSLSRQSTLATIANAMMQPGAVSFKDRRWHFRLYEGTFLGSECVDWMVDAFPDIDSREAAVAFGDELLEKGFFIHVNQKHRFLDGYYYYRLSEEFAPARSFISKGLRWLAGSKSVSPTDTSSTAASKTKLANEGQALKSDEQGTGSTTDLSAPRRPVELSRSIIVDMDPQKRSNRRELAIVHYDTLHNPKACYHFQLHWLSCTARLMEDMLLSWARMADKCGLKMVEAPVEQIKEFSADNPFRSVSVIHLHLEPPAREDVKSCLSLDVEIPALWFEMEFLRSQGFIIDVEADSRFPEDSTKHSYTRPPHTYTQLVHRSGLVFVSCEIWKILRYGKQNL